MCVYDVLLDAREWILLRWQILLIFGQFHVNCKEELWAFSVGGNKADVTVEMVHDLLAKTQPERCSIVPLKWPLLHRSKHLEHFCLIDFFYSTSSVFYYESQLLLFCQEVDQNRNFAILGCAIDSILNQVYCELLKSEHISNYLLGKLVFSYCPWFLRREELVIFFFTFVKEQCDVF